MQLYATTSNSGKSSLTRLDTSVAGLASSASLIDAGFGTSYRQYTIADSTFRTPGLNIGVTNGANTYYFVYVEAAHTTPGVWTTTSVTSTSGSFNLYGPGAPGASTSMTLADWSSNATWSPVIFGAGARVTELGFTLGSSQRNAYVYLDWVESSLIDGGERNDFAAIAAVPLPGAAAAGVALMGLMAGRRRRA